MEEERWVEKALQYNGKLILWVDQGSDSLLQAANSDGVCFAMSLDFVLRFQKSQDDSSNFVNDIRNTSLTEPKSNRIPEKYLKLQVESQAKLVQYRETLITLYRKYEEAESAEKSTRMLELKQLLRTRIADRFGPTMNEHMKFKVANTLASNAIFERMKEMVAKDGPSFFFVSMRGEEKGHAIAFGLIPNLEVDKKDPGIYYFFDANLGFFFFGKEEDLAHFFDMEVWLELYGNTDYSNFKITSFKTFADRF